MYAIFLKKLNAEIFLVFPSLSQIIYAHKARKQSRFDFSGVKRMNCKNLPDEELIEKVYLYLWAKTEWQI